MKIAIIVAVIALLSVIGVGLYVTDFTAYLGSNPQTCNNCHVMDYVYENWYHGVHSKAASCNDCHTPHALIPKYLVKAQSGYHHVTAFLSRNIPAAIRPKVSSQKVIQENCVRCHAETVSTIIESSMSFDRYCFDCHRTVAHGERGVALFPYQHPEENK